MASKSKRSFKYNRGGMRAWGDDDGLRDRPFTRLLPPIGRRGAAGLPAAGTVGLELLLHGREFPS